MTNQIKKIGIYSFIILGLALPFLAMTSQKETLNFNEPNQPEELGKVNWLRNFDEAIATSKKKQKPVLILFQEVPGCSTCRNYGNNILSHPLIVEAIETAFIPVAIFNNKGGKDREVLNYFGEPTWNNPVVRIVNSNKKDITPRLGGDYSALGLVLSMINAMNLNGDVIPEYLRLLKQELAAEKTGTEKTTVAMYCFWTGEREIGKLDGVVSTQPGFMNGREVVEIEYNPEIIEYENLISAAGKSRCADHVYAKNETQKKEASKVFGNSKVSSTSNFRMDREPKYYLSKTHYQYVPMTISQQTKANALVGQRKSPKALLSPRQIQLADHISKNGHLNLESAINVDLEKAWEKIEKTLKNFAFNETIGDKK